MPFPMVHLVVAHNLGYAAKISDLSRYYLGVLAPDAYLARAHYTFEDRKASHLAGDDPMHSIQDVLHFVKQHKDSMHPDFYTGYGVHLLTDVFWESIVYQPFLHAHSQAGGPHASSPRQAYMSDMTSIDLWLYRNCAFRSELWACLARAESMDAHSLATAEEIDVEKAKTLAWYDRKKDREIGGFQYIDPAQVTGFMQKAVREIDSLLLGIV